MFCKTPAKFKICFSTFMLLFVVVHSFSQSKIKGNREVRIEQTELTDFHTITIGDGFDVVLVKSTSPSVTLEADDNLHSVVQYAVNDSILNFQVTQLIKRSKEFKVYIRYTEPLKTIMLSGDVDVEAENAIQLTELKLTLKDDAKIDASVITEKFTLENRNSSGLKLTTNCKLNIESKIVNLDLMAKSNNTIKINAEELNISTIDKADLNIDGFSYRLNVDASGNSDIDAKNLLTNISKIKVSEKAQASVQVSDTINIDASGYSKLQLYGDPKINIEKLSDSAVIEKKQL